MSGELKPCPFCGEEKACVLAPTCNRNSVYDPKDRAFPVVRCTCRAEVHGENWDQRGTTAIAAWNRRATPSLDGLRALVSWLRSLAISYELKGGEYEHGKACAYRTSADKLAAEIELMESMNERKLK